jgi:hypothetical protein
MATEPTAIPTDQGTPAAPVEEGTVSEEQTPVAPEPAGQEPGTQPDTGFTNINPDDLPEPLLAVYKNMQADYTKKTQTIAEERKYAETFKAALEQSGMTLEDFQKMRETPDQEPEPVAPEEQTVDPNQPSPEEIQRANEIWLRTPAGNQWRQDAIAREIKGVEDLGYNFKDIKPEVDAYYKTTHVNLPLADVCAIIQGRRNQKLAGIERNKQAEIDRVKNNSNIPVDQSAVAGGGVSPGTGNSQPMSIFEAAEMAARDLGM